MRTTVKRYQAILVIGDVLLLYAGLLVTLAIRYPQLDSPLLSAHVGPFSILFFFTILAWYIIGLYDVRELKNSSVFAARFAASFAISFLIALIIFYFSPPTSITPKTNLLIFFALVATGGSLWRTAYNSFLAVRTNTRLLLIDHTPVVSTLAAHLSANPQLGHRTVHWLKEGLPEREEVLTDIIRSRKVQVVILPARYKKDSRAMRMVYAHLAHGVDVVDLAVFYGDVFGKIPLPELEQGWPIEYHRGDQRGFDTLRRVLELTITLPIAIVCIPLGLLIACTIKMMSPGSAFFTQIRVGENGRPFVLWKFRTMVPNAEAGGPRWSTPHDQRVTPFGRFLRRTHLDELPQLINILRGELSLVGPRPERPEFVIQLREQIPFYDLRHALRPGLTGWAQVNYRYGASADESYEKLQYDLYYLTHRSFMLDIAIIMRTAKRFFVPAQ